MWREPSSFRNADLISLLDSETSETGGSHPLGLGRGCAFAGERSCRRDRQKSDAECHAGLVCPSSKENSTERTHMPVPYHGCEACILCGGCADGWVRSQAAEWSERPRVCPAGPFCCGVRFLVTTPTPRKRPARVDQILGWFLGGEDGSINKGESYTPEFRSVERQNPGIRDGAVARHTGGPKVFVNVNLAPANES